MTLLITAAALGMDAFAVATAIATGLPAFTRRHTFRLAWHFGLFQALMTVVGWYGGSGLSTFMHGLNHWIAFGLLIFIGGKMIYESRQAEERAADFDPTRGWSLVILSLATSIDALAVGVSLSLLGVSVWWPAVAIGLAALAMTFVGTRIGRGGQTFLGQWAEVTGGVVLIAIGLRILIVHLTA
ncbi:manganese efflux pump MntP family protein [Thermodesulfobacteriota bacterium]